MCSEELPNWCQVMHNKSRVLMKFGFSYGDIWRVMLEYALCYFRCEELFALVDELFFHCHRFTSREWFTRCPHLPNASIFAVSQVEGFNPWLTSVLTKSVELTVGCQNNSKGRQWSTKFNKRRTQYNGGRYSTEIRRRSVGLYIDGANSSCLRG